jgi:hypothetical protein
MAHVEPPYVRLVGAVPVFQFQSMIVPGHVPPPELELLLDEPLLDDDELLLDDDDEPLLDDDDEPLLDDDEPELLLDEPLLDDDDELLLDEPLLDDDDELLLDEPLDPPLPPCPPIPPTPLLVDELDPPEPPQESSPPSPPLVGSGCDPVAHAPTMQMIAMKPPCRWTCRCMRNSVVDGCAEATSATNP